MVDDRRRTTTDDRPTTTDDRPTTNDDRPPTDDERPPTDDEYAFRWVVAVYSPPAPLVGGPLRTMTSVPPWGTMLLNRIMMTASPLVQEVEMNCSVSW